ncbi:CsbD family protein [Nocardia noduli]|uniref:CsbD family protein n=1 Tax=Nocardia noduli TaxID=2815722 RepID=UPI001C24A2B0|nr:CsbD family protein [Nocardia noduli]
MSIAEKLAYKVEAVGGSAKRKLGGLTGDTRLRVRGRGEQIAGNTKLAAVKFRDAFKH